ncbi:ABC transporter permease [bacterium]|nr:ABC transporter permease [bacterium]
MHRQPPKLAEWILKFILVDDLWYTPLGDFEEFFQVIVHEDTIFKARLWYWKQIFILFPKKLRGKLREGGDMFNNYWKMALRHFKRQTVYAAINLIGLIVGMTVAILFLLWVRDERAFDRFHVNHEDVYRVVADWPKYGWDGLENTPAPLAEAIESELSEVVNLSRIWFHNRNVFRVEDRFFYESRGIFVDPGFFEMFSFPEVEGESGSALDGPQDIFITASLAERYFPNQKAVGQVIYADEEPLTVRGILADPPRHSTLQFDYVQAFKHVAGYSTHWNACQFTLFIQPSPNSNLEEIAEKMTAIAKDNGSWHVKNGLTFRLQPILEMHLDARSYQRESVVLGDSKVVMLFTAIALFAILLACVNFINLSTARAMTRAKEVGLRKTLGARRGQLIAQFLGESMIYSGIAVFVAIMLSAILLPWFNAFTGKALAMEIADWGLWRILLSLFLASGLLAGAYPAILLSGFQSIAVLKSIGNKGSHGAGMRQGLVVLQFAIALLLMISSMAINKQIHFIRNKDLGLAKDHVITIPLKGPFAEQFESVEQELLRNSQIASVSGVWNDVSRETWRGSQNWKYEGKTTEGKELDIINTGVDFDYFKTMGITLTAGRLFSKSFASDSVSSLIFNEAAIRELQIDNPVGKWFEMGGKRCTIIGIASDVHYLSLQNEISPRVYFIRPMKECQSSGQALIKIRGENVQAAVNHIEKVYTDVNRFMPFEFQFLDQVYNRLYHQEHQISTLLNLLTGLGIFISCLGLFGLAAFMVERRTKEIGIRKTLGASEFHIWGGLTNEFIIWVAIANVPAWPAAYWLIGKALKSYAYRIDIQLDLFILPALLTLFVAVITVSVQSIRAMRTQPAIALRDE